MAGARAGTSHAAALRRGPGPIDQELADYVGKKGVDRLLVEIRSEVDIERRAPLAERHTRQRTTQHVAHARSLEGSSHAQRDGNGIRHTHASQASASWP